MRGIGATSGATHGSSGSTGRAAATASSSSGGCGLQTCSSVGATCGPIGDGCGGILDCGSCTPPETCGGGGTPSVCGGTHGCVPHTCASEHADCGPVADGCGNLLQCGTCNAPESCGGAGQLNTCGLSTLADGGALEADGGCVRQTCTSLGINCGPAGDGCGGALSCGTCNYPEECGGGGTPSVCGLPQSICQPATCASQHFNCGPAGDGCGNLIDGGCGACTAPDSCGGGGQANVCGSLGADGGTLIISAPSHSMVVQGGTPATLQLTAQLVTAAGTQNVSANWSSSRPDLASVDQTGLVTAPGPLGGTVTLTAGYLGLLATAPITIAVTQQTCSPDCTTAPPSAFGSTPMTGVAQSPSFLYPYNQTVIPVNLQPLDFQWNAGSGNDLFQLTVSGTLGTLTATVSPANPAQPDFAFDASVWEPFAHSNIGQTVTVTLVGTSSASPGTTYAAPSQTLTLASSRMAGTIYYWAVSAGDVYNIPAGGTTATQVYAAPTPPSNSGWTAPCIACHAVSPDGTKMAATLWGGGGPGTVLNLFGDGGANALYTPTPPSGYASDPAWDFSTFDSTSSYMVTASGGSLTLRDATTAAPVPSGSATGNLTGLGCGPGSTCTQPVWSRDGSYLIFGLIAPGNMAADYSFTDSSLLLSQWSAGTQTFSSPTTVVTDSYDGTTEADVYPTISVDDTLIAFTRSTCSYASTDPCAHQSALALLPITGGTPIPLSQAEILSDGTTDTSSRYPNFSPFKEGGYHWMAFFTLRPYGWVTSNVRQIWITAIDDTGTPTSDPSHPAFWLPGQQTSTDNDRAQWATLPCVGQGQTCQGDIDCCGSPTSLVCDYTGGVSVCEPPAGACGFWGASCATSADCCSPSQCESGVCCTPLTCAELGLTCGPASDGCGNILECGTCNGGQTCGGGGVAGQCGSIPCSSRTCAEQGLDCGPAGDGCGNPLDCGECDAGTCGGSGVPGVCGTGAHCTPEDCAVQGLDCGPAGDGCGHQISCGGCDGGLTCGGGGTPGVCGEAPCTKQTCTGLGYDCGEAADGCGGTIDCGGCDGGSTCGGGGHANVCGNMLLK